MRIVLLILFMAFSMTSFAQKVYNDYTFYPQEEGNLYFIFPQKGFTNTSESAHGSTLVYDLTYFTATDSVVFAYTYTNLSALKTDSVSFADVNGTHLYTAKADMLFIQPVKNQWMHRAIVKIPYQQLIELYSRTDPYTIQMHTSTGTINYSMKTNKWKKQSYLISRIFEMVAYN